jgi:methionyl-tRNA synthetase
VPQPGELTEADEALLALARAVPDTARRHVDTQALHLYVEACWKVLSEANRYFSAQEPWKLKKTDPDRMATVLWVTIEVVRIISILIQPVMPDSAGKILDLLGVPAGAGEAGAKVLPTADRIRVRCRGDGDRDRGCRHRRRRRCRIRLSRSRPECRRGGRRWARRRRY